MKPSLLLSICFLSMLLTGCPAPAMEVKVTNSSANNLNLEVLTHDGLLGTTYPQKVSTIYFSKESKKGKMDAIWSVKSQEKDGRTLTKIVYGETPIGFNATTPHPILPGDILHVSFYAGVQGIPDYLGETEFTVSK